MRVGYARVSTHEQNLSLQIDELKKSGCSEIFTDKISGAKSERPGLQKVIGFLREGDILVVWRLDRLGRSLKHLIEVITFLEERNIGFSSIQESIDSTTSGGKLIFHIFGALAEFERNLICERTKAGLAAARARGRKGGRPRALDDRKIKLMRNLYNSKKHPVSEICDSLGVSKSTLYNYLKG